MKVLYYVLSCTWGLLMTAIGAVVTAIACLLGAKPILHHGAVCTVIGKNWGGINLGLFFLCNEDASEHTKNHEYGHSLQNCIWGPLMPFGIGLPSLIRCTYYNWYYANKYQETKKPLADYDTAWFEGQATRWGDFHAELDKRKDD